LASLGHENGKSAGLGLIPGEIHKLVPNHKDERIPHMGWNEGHQQWQQQVFFTLPNKHH